MVEIYDLDLSKLPKYFKDEKEIAAFFGVSLTTVGNWKLDKRFPKETKQGFLGSAVLTVFMSKREKDNRNNSSDNSPLKDQKLEKEIEILQLRIEQLKGEWITVTDHLAEFFEYAGIVKGMLVNLPSIIAANGHEPEVVEEVRHECNGVLGKIQAILEPED